MPAMDAGVWPLQTSGRCPAGRALHLTSHSADPVTMRGRALGDIPAKKTWFADCRREGLGSLHLDGSISGPGHIRKQSLTAEALLSDAATGNAGVRLSGVEAGKSCQIHSRSNTRTDRAPGLVRDDRRKASGPAAQDIEGGHDFLGLAAGIDCVVKKISKARIPRCGIGGGDTQPLHALYFG